jgi:hypothetical protein
MPKNCIVINVQVPRNALAPQVIRDNNPLPEGYIRWSLLAFADFTTATATAYVGFFINGQLIPIASALALAQNSLLSMPGIMTLPSDYIPAAWVTGGVAADLLQFVAIGEVLDAIPGQPISTTPY